MENQTFTHLLQKKGILKNFSVAKIVRKKDIDELKKLVRELASDEEEYNRILKEEMDRLSNMHDKDNPIPGIIYADNSVTAKRNLIFALSQKIAAGIEKQGFSKQDLALLISSIISKLELDQEDFMKLNENLSEELDGEEDDEDYEEDDEDEF